MKDYSYLKGRELILRQDHKFLKEESGEHVGFVANIDFERGVTIKSLETQNDLFCLNSKSKYSVSYEIWFDYIVKCIEAGEYIFNALPEQMQKGSGSNCAFE